MSDIFDAVQDSTKKSANAKDFAARVALVLASKIQRAEIDQVRRERALIRNNTLRKSGINGALITLDLHPLEYQACELLCPELKLADNQAKKKAWQWILKQPWAQEFKASPLEHKTWHMPTSSASSETP